MTSFLGRYQQGEYEEVWAELLALGEQVRTEPVYTAMPWQWHTRPCVVPASTFWGITIQTASAW